MFREFWKTLPSALARSFTVLMLPWHALAIVLTIALLESGIDWSYFSANRTSILQHLALPAGALGFFIPILAPVIVYGVGAAYKSLYDKRAAFALAQAALAGWLISAFFKIFTGRFEPPFRTVGPLTDASHGFHFGILEHGVFWGWPSSHATVAFAAATALVLLYPKNRLIAVFAVCYAAVIALGASVSFHWLSDVVAGAIFGTIVGITVARAYRDRATP